MEIPKECKILSITRFKEIPYLVHGFGTGIWEEHHLRRSKEWKNFRLIFLNQIHSNIIHFIESGPLKNLDGDAMITSLPHLLLIIKTADCLPVLAVEESRKVIAAIHCGWRGTKKRVAQHAVKGMESRYGCVPSSLLVALGSCIGPECYEVGSNVLESYEEEGLSLDIFRPCPNKKDVYLLDLKEANIIQLLSLGVKKENIFSIDFCSHCSEIMPSFRREGKMASRMLSFIGMSF
ncbi:MAG: peptidoglycan editing factor PgeF [Candidatus Aminicenantaceae bacterium]